MTYDNAYVAAKACRTFEDVDALLAMIEEAYETISDRQYYNLKHIALDTVVNNA